MTDRDLMGTVVIAGALLSLLLSAVTRYQIVAKVNAKLPKDEQFWPVIWYHAKRRRLRLQYKRLYPSGKLLEREVLLALISICLLICALSIGYLVK
jgi:hypothetical protein